MSQSKPVEAYDHLLKEYNYGIPAKSYLVRELLNELVGLLLEQTGKQDYFMKALKIDPGNAKLKRYLLK